MRLDGPESSNVEDRRGGGGGGGGRIAIGGIGGVILVVVSLLLGIDPTTILQGDAQAPAQPQRQQARVGKGQPQEHDLGRQFVSRVLAETESVWTAEFARARRVYDPPTLVLFSGATQSGCGYAQAQMGPFYCPNDARVYIDLDFMADLQRRLGANGDFAAAYIVAHEVGHHVQNLLGTLRRTQSARDNATQVRVELQADCYAGVWANRAQAARQILEEGDIEEGLNAAAAVGDDRIQRRSQGRVSPETFTHGSSEQRVGWFRRGLAAGRPEACDTFGR
ncbi:KPN_02809 family neutral zinc metallopeptidase [Humitalea sp. 24SJ18S-53]|uniref:KPN_02809 family neutral zinc metallopeptidase n=1 Tax=Humitalea sp. 24SJ18S-53 TaxID=3422307 RepID=UPI003D677772